MDNPIPKNRTELTTQLQRLWQSGPSSYWPRATGPTPQDVWPAVAVRSEGAQQTKLERKR